MSGKTILKAKCNVFSGLKLRLTPCITLVAAGPIGRNAEAAGSASFKHVAPIYSYSKTRGLFAGISLEGKTFSKLLQNLRYQLILRIFCFSGRDLHKLSNFNLVLSLPCSFQAQSS